MSNLSEFKSVEHGKYMVTGDLTFANVSSVWQGALKLLPGVEEAQLDIDIGAADEVDSGGIALLVAWARWAYCNNKQLVFSNVPQQTQKLIQINKLQEVLKIA